MDAFEVEGSEAIEVRAEFDGAIVDVRHLVRDDVGGDRRARRLVAAGGAALALAAGAFVAACAGVPLPRAIDAAVAVALAGGTWALVRGLSRLGTRPPERYTVGGAAASFAVAPGAMPLAAFPLVRVDELGDWELTFLPPMAGGLVIDGAARALGAWARPSSLVPGALCTRLGAGARAWLRIGDVTFDVANVPAPRRTLHAPPIDWRRELHLAAVAAVVGAFLLCALLVPPAPQSLALDLLHDLHAARFLLAPPAEPLERPSGHALAGASVGAGGERSRGPSGRTGRRDAPHATGRIIVAGTPSRERVAAAARAAAVHAGVLPFLAGTQVGSIFGPDRALGADADRVLVGLQGVELTDGWGSGTALVGDGPGGGGDRDEATIGAGPLRGVGPDRLGGGSGYARGVGGLHGRRAHAPPDVVPGIATVCGGGAGACLDKEIIRRVVRQHRNEVRFCYERALAADPTLAGRVLAQFTIAPNGRVLASAARESTAGPAAAACIAAAVRRWEFPASSQTVTVSYPFILQTPR